jgi:hypothetical protein
LPGQHIVSDFLDIRGYHECCTFKTVACKTYTQAGDCSRNMKGQDIIKFTLPFLHTLGRKSRYPRMTQKALHSEVRSSEVVNGRCPTVEILSFVGRHARSESLH